MHFIVDDEYKVIFGWSAKCGCSHIKRIFRLLKYNITSGTSYEIHKLKNYTLPNDIENYTTIIICRNPYKRLVSGFLDKYKFNGEFRHMWKYKYITFSAFVYELLKSNWNVVEKNHFAPQISDNFDKNKILKSKCIKCYDIENIDYNFIEKIYNKKIPLDILNKKEGHERKKYTNNYSGYVYNMYMYKYYNYNVDIKYFYDTKLKEQVHKFYEQDFIFFNEFGFNYEL